MIPAFKLLVLLMPFLWNLFSQSTATSNPHVSPLSNSTVPAQVLATGTEEHTTTSAEQPDSMTAVSHTTRSPVHHRHGASATWPWFLVLLSGNSTVASQRQRDLATYLRLNLAARLDADYNDVAINRVLLTHGGIVANISVEASHLVGIGALGLQQLTKGNVTLLQLSGQEFLVKKILRANDIASQRIIELDNDAEDPEVAIYGAVGAFLLFLFFLVLLGLVFHGPCKRYDKQPYDEPFDQQDDDSVSTELKMICSMPPVIYTEQLAKEMNDAANLVHTCANGCHCAAGQKASSSTATWTHPWPGKKSPFLYGHHQQRAAKNSLHFQRHLSADDDVQAILSRSTSIDPADAGVNSNSNCY